MKIRWTEEEVELLKELYPNQDNSEAMLCNKFNRNWEAIKGMAKRLELKRGNKGKTKDWTDEDIVLLKGIYSDITLTNEQICQQMDRTWSSIANMAHRLQLNRENTNYWSKKDNDYLKSCYQDKSVSMEEIQKRLPNQSLQSIYTKAFEMGLDRQWKDEEVKLLKNIYSLEETTDEILLSTFPGRTLDGMAYKAGGFNLKRYREYNPVYWSIEDMEKLKSIYSDINILQEELIDIFGRSWDSIRKKAAIMGLERKGENKIRTDYSTVGPNSYQIWSYEEIELLKELYPSYKNTNEELCNQFGREWCAIKSKARKLGLPSRPRKRYEVESDYFDIIDTDIKAYLLGFFFADGNVNGSGWFKLDLSIKDIEIVELFRNEIAPDAQIKEYSNGIVTFSINDVYLCNSMIKYGIVTNKGDQLTWPTELPEKFSIPFIMGYFDGDGTLCINKRSNRWQWGVLGCYDLLKGMKDRIEQQINIDIKGPRPSGGHHPTNVITKSGDDVLKINDLFMKYSIGLMRKRCHGYKIKD